MIKTNLGDLKLSLNQMARMSDLHSALIQQFEFESANVYVLSYRELNDAEKVSIVSDLKALSNDPLDEEKDKTEFTSHPFFKKTPAEVQAYIETNVNDLPTAKSVMKQMAKALSYLLRRSNLNQ